MPTGVGICEVLAESTNLTDLVPGVLGVGGGAVRVVAAASRAARAAAWTRKCGGKGSSSAGAGFVALLLLLLDFATAAVGELVLTGFPVLLDASAVAAFTLGRLPPRMTTEDACTRNTPFAPVFRTFASLQNLRLYRGLASCSRPRLEDLALTRTPPGCRQETRCSCAMGRRRHRLSQPARLVQKW